MLEVRSRAAAFVATAVLAGCGSPGNGAQPDAGVDPSRAERQVGQHELPSLDAICDGRAGITGRAVLDLKVEHLEGTLSYVTATGSAVDPTPVTIDLTWPEAPVAICYPKFQPDGGGVSAEARVAIAGLTISFKTADGKFAESIPAKAWMTVINGPLVTAVTSRPQLKGTWKPFTEYENAGNTVLISTFLTLTGPGKAGGNVGLSQEDPADLNAFILKGRFAVATYK